MPDNKTLPATGTGTANIVVATRTVTYSGDAADVQVVGIGAFAGSDDAKTVVDVPAGGGVEATALRVTIASDSTGVLSVDDNGSSLTVDGTVTPGPTLDLTQNGSLTTGTLTDTFTVGDGVSAVALRVSGTWVGTVVFEGSVDATLWDPIYGVRAGIGVPYTSITEALNDNIFRFTTAGFSKVRAVFTRTSGTVTIAWRASHSTSGVYVNFPLPPGTNNIGSVALPGTATNIASQVTVTNSSTAIVAARATRSAVLLVNQQTVAVYIDPTGGTATTSMFRLDPGASVTLPVVTAVTGITSAAYSASGDAKVHILDAF